MGYWFLPDQMHENALFMYSEHLEDFRVGKGLSNLFLFASFTGKEDSVK